MTSFTRTALTAAALTTLLATNNGTSAADIFVKPPGAAGMRPPVC